jgi:hypothetical protein
VVFSKKFLSPIRTKLLSVIIHFMSTNLTHALMIECHADFANDVTRLFNNDLF